MKSTFKLLGIVALVVLGFSVVSCSNGTTDDTYTMRRFAIDDSDYSSIFPGSGIPPSSGYQFVVLSGTKADLMAKFEAAKSKTSYIGMADRSGKSLSDVETYFQDFITNDGMSVADKTQALNELKSEGICVVVARSGTNQVLVFAFYKE